MTGPAVEPRHGVVQYPGGIRATYRWTGSGRGDSIFALTETGGPLRDVGSEAAEDPDAVCRAEVRVESPAGPWTLRLASRISDEPAAIFWDTAGLLVIKYGFHVYGVDARTGDVRWIHRSATPVLAVIGSPRLQHVLVQAEIETFAIEADGTVGWRVAHSDVVTDVELVGGRLILTSFDGQRSALDPSTGRASG
ncbi:MAG: PQQ-binding-like beta-propeller repeat protein [Chloroflexota bacterium]